MAPWYLNWQVGAACLLVETGQGLTLVDTGLGLHDYLRPSLMVRFFRAGFGIANDPERTAFRQVVRLGYRPEDVTDIIQTHLHFDHAGGLPDFPHARVHVHLLEYQSLQHPRGWIERAYDRCDFEHGPRWVLYSHPTAEWRGFDAIPLPFTPDMYFIPLFGHTSGHCGVAIREGSGWLFHCADALPANANFDITPAWMNRLVLGPHVPCLRDWAAANPDVRLLAGHMWLESFNEE